MSKNKTWGFLNQVTLERTNAPRLIALVGLLVMTILAATCSGCAAIGQFTDDHPQAVVVVEISALAVGGVMMGKAIAKSGRVQVVAQPRTNLGPM